MITNTTNVRNVAVREVIIVETLKGDGTHKDPHRQVTQFWSKEGEFLAERDDLENGKTQARAQDEQTFEF